jgi:GNAT superfamily N-acetyltransferase
MPMQFVIDGKREKGYYVHDLYVDPECRRRGLGVWITMLLARAIEENTDSFFCLFGMNELNREIQRRRNYHEMNADMYVKVINPRRGLSRTLGREGFLVNAAAAAAKVLLSVCDGILMSIFSSGLQVKRLERFDERFDDFNEKILHRIGICAWKNSRYLNWKYVDRPYSDDVVMAAERNGRIAGYVVLAILPDRNISVGQIKDIMADPDDRKAVSALCIAAVAHFRKRNVDRIGCVLSDRRFTRVFRRFFFLRIRNVKGLFLGNLEGCANRERLMDINNWHITRGESDGYMLEKLS